MNSDRKIQKALISVYDKNLILDIANELVSLGVEILSTGGTQQYLGSHNIPVTAVEDLTGYPSIFGGRVKTLHPKIMGGILYRREEASDVAERERYDIPGIDIIEKIDIGGISLIRAAAKNYNDVIIVAGKESYSDLLTLLREKKGHSSIEDRRAFAAKAFLKSSNYDTHIFQYFNRKEQIPAFTASETRATHLRYGENPHQKALYFGSETSLPEQLHGKEISYNNMLDIEAALELISDFDETAVAVIKHNNACGCAIRRHHRRQPPRGQGYGRGDAQDILRGGHRSRLRARGPSDTRGEEEPHHSQDCPGPSFSREVPLDALRRTGTG